MKERTFNNLEVLHIGLTIKWCLFLCRLNLVTWAFITLNKLAFKYGYENWADMCNHCGFK